MINSLHHKLSTQGANIVPERTRIMIPPEENTYIVVKNFDPDLPAHWERWSVIRLVGWRQDKYQELGRAIKARFRKKVEIVASFNVATVIRLTCNNPDTVRQQIETAFNCAMIHNQRVSPHQ